ncbi:MAG: SMP-30/gluconolactonase/LRE family protein [Cyclobacteriaceae bacterium]
MTRYLLFILSILLTGNLQAQVSKSTVAFTSAKNDLLPESVGYDDNSQAFYLGSTRNGTITKIDKNGKQSTFVKGGKFGQWMVVGIKVDSKRNELWFCSSGGENLVGYSKTDDKEGRPAGIFKVDLTSGKLIKKYTLEKTGEVHFFNDLVIDSEGNVYASHMFKDHTIYKIDRDTDRLEPFVQSDLIKYPNGMDISDNRKYLFVAHSEGLAKIDIDSRTATNLTVPEGIKVSRRESVDGLYYYKWSLIGIQADLNTVTRYYLNEDGSGIHKVETLDMNHPKMDHPTTGVLVNDSFYYVANAQFQKVNEDGSITKELSDPTILKLELR